MLDPIVIEEQKAADARLRAALLRRRCMQFKLEYQKDLYASVVLEALADVEDAFADRKEQAVAAVREKAGAED